MPGGFATAFGAANFNDIGTVTGASVLTSVTCAGANAKGSYAQLTASTPYDCCGFFVQIGVAGSNASGYLIDIAVGAAASEVVIVPNIPFGQVSANSYGMIFVPIAIPAGTRIAARGQCSTGSNQTIRVGVILFDGAFDEEQPLASPQNYGASTSTSLGTQIDPGTTINTKGAWVQLTASTTYDIGALQVIFDNNKGGSLSNSWLIDIAVGAGGSEQVIIPNIALSCGSGGALIGAFSQLFRVNIPAGTRIACRAQSSSATSGNRLFDATVLGYQQ